MNNAKSNSISAVANVVVWGFITFSGQAVSASFDADAERVSQYINEADLKREFSNENSILVTKSKVINRSLPSIREHRKILLKRSMGWFNAKSKTLKVSVPDTGNRAVQLSRANNSQGTTSFIVSLPNVAENPIDAKMASDGSVVYSNYQQATDVAVQSFDDSARILTILNGIDSPSEYDYRVNLPVGGKIEKIDNGGIIVLDKQARLMGGFATPWAVDNSGKQIPTHYEIRGNHVIQIVEHLADNTDYPVVADPWIGLNLIKFATWIPKGGTKWTLAVTPTAWARSNAAFALSATNYAIGLAGWNELYARYKNFDRGLTRNLTSMKNQYICHQHATITALKSTWNLDEWRPNVGYPATILLKLCNP